MTDVPSCRVGTGSRSSCTSSVAHAKVGVATPPKSRRPLCMASLSPRSRSSAARRFSLTRKFSGASGSVAAATSAGVVEATWVGVGEIERLVGEMKRGTGREVARMKDERRTSVYRRPWPGFQTYIHTHLHARMNTQNTEFTHVYTYRQDTREPMASKRQQLMLSGVPTRCGVAWEKRVGGISRRRPGLGMMCRRERRCRKHRT
jgi:hypothetical protein